MRCSAAVFAASFCSTATVGRSSRLCSALSDKWDDRAAAEYRSGNLLGDGRRCVRGIAPLESPALSHACEYETSMMLHLFPQRVKLSRARRASRPAKSEYIGWEDDVPYRGVTMVKRTHFISDNGGSGQPQRATAAKGRHLVEKAVSAAVDFVDSFKTWPIDEELETWQKKKLSRRAFRERSVLAWPLRSTAGFTSAVRSAGFQDRQSRSGTIERGDAPHASACG